jgi:hypothetical protein
MNIKHVVKLDPSFDVIVGNFRVYTNGSDELFVELDNGPTLRISDLPNNKLLATSHGNIIQPTAINGLDAFRITKP